ncbi:MAG TPA: hypothetical protein VEA99_13120 [Gemmatimonadaceae bacterium]|nr:hypothetical protein [Gemmatimonadaceae bacterium]
MFETIESLRLVASCQSNEAPTDAEWDAWLAAVKALGRTVSEFRLLVLTEGGRPTKEQRDRLLEAKRAGERAKGKALSEPRTALVSSAAGERFLVSVLVFMNPAIRCFAPSEIEAAYAHLRLTDPTERQLADAAVSRLRAMLAAR